MAESAVNNEAAKPERLSRRDLALISASLAGAMGFIIGNAYRMALDRKDAPERTQQEPRRPLEHAVSPAAAIRIIEQDIAGMGIDVHANPNDQGTIQSVHLHAMAYVQALLEVEHEMGVGPPAVVGDIRDDHMEVWLARTRTNVQAVRGHREHAPRIQALRQQFDSIARRTREILERMRRERPVRPRNEGKTALNVSPQPSTAHPAPAPQAA